MKYLAMIQARCGSTRLPNKVLMNLSGKPQLQWVIERVGKSRYIDEVMVVTSIEKNNLPIVRVCADLNVRIGIGSEEDVLDRYYQIAKLIHPEYVIRITADCPCIDAEIIDYGIEQLTADIDYCSNTIKETYADGLDFEIIKYSALENAWCNAEHLYEREHVTQYIIHHPEIFRLKNVESDIGDFSNQRWTVDEPEDFQLISRIYKYFVEEQDKPDFGYKDILDFIRDNQYITDINSKFKRNEGLLKSKREDRIVLKR